MGATHSPPITVLSCWPWCSGAIPENGLCGSHPWAGWPGNARCNIDRNEDPKSCIR